MNMYNYTEEGIKQAELDEACKRLRKALTPYAIERKVRREREYTLYVQLAWEGRRK